MEVLEELAAYFPEYAEAVRMKKIYDGLKVGAATRPQYVFQGKDRDWYRKYHPDKKTKTVFTMGAPPGPLSNFMVMGGNPGTFFMRADGTAANKGAAGGPGSSISACMDVSVHNGETFAAGDELVLASDGGDFLDQFTIPSAGAAGSPITYQAESGDSPMVNGSSLVTGWTLDSGNIWKASFAPTFGTFPGKVFLDNTLGTKETVKANVNAANEWFYDDVADELFVYSTSDPDTAFTSPGIEATSREFCIKILNVNYITIDGIDCSKAEAANIKPTGTSHTTRLLNLTTSECGNGHGVLQTGTGPSNTYMSNVTTRDNGVTAGDHGFYFGAPTNANGTFLIEDCIGYGNQGQNFNIYNSGSGTIRRCLVYDAKQRSGFNANQLFDDSDVTYEYCIGYDNAWMGFRANSNGVDFNGNNDIFFYNCVAYSNNDYSGFAIYDNAVVNTNVTMKNCISYDNLGASNNKGELWVNDNNAGVITLDNNAYFYTAASSTLMITYELNTYTQDTFSSYQSTESQDGNSISSDPLFEDAAGNNFKLHSSSPCINAGTDLSLTLDNEGRRVPRGSAPDIGAHEFKKRSAVARMATLERAI